MKNQTSSLKAGFGRRDITPQNSCFLVGYPHAERISTGVHDPLFASAVCLESDGQPVLIVSLDVLFISADWTRDCRECITQQTGIPSEAILIGATHTHSGPHTAEILAWKDDPVVPPVDQTYLAWLREQTLAAATEAWQGRMPAEGAWCVADVQGLAGGNRVDPRGVEDPEAGLLLLRRALDGKAIAIISVYGMHPTVLHEDSKLVSSDFIGFTRETVESAFHGAGMVYLNGVCGNQSPRRVVKAQTFAEAQRIGSALGARMVETLCGEASFTSAFPVRAAIREVELTGKTFPLVEKAEQNLARAQEHFLQLRRENAPASLVRTAECTVFGAEEVLTLAKAELSGDAEALRGKYRHVEIQALRLGEALVVAWPGELFVEYGLDLKARSSAKIFISTMANGELQGYVVTPEAEAVCGYEAQMSLFPASAGAKIVDATLKLIEEIP
jgi:hypothetical protein